MVAKLTKAQEAKLKADAMIGLKLIRQAQKEKRSLSWNVKASNPRAKVKDYLVIFFGPVRTCSCPDYVQRREARGEVCKHITMSEELVTRALKRNVYARAHIGRLAHIHY